MLNKASTAEDDSVAITVLCSYAYHVHYRQAYMLIWVPEATYFLRISNRRDDEIYVGNSTHNLKQLAKL